MRETDRDPQRDSNRGTERKQTLMAILGFLHTQENVLSHKHTESGQTDGLYRQRPPHAQNALGLRLLPGLPVSLCGPIILNRASIEEAVKGGQTNRTEKRHRERQRLRPTREAPGAQSRTGQTKRVTAS